MGLIKETSYDAPGPGCKARMYTARARARGSVCRCMCTDAAATFACAYSFGAHVCTHTVDVVQTRRQFWLLREASKHLSTYDDVPRLFVRWLPPSCTLVRYAASLLNKISRSD